MQSKWSPRAKNAVAYSVLERPKMRKIRAKVARMLINRRFRMLNLLWRRSLKKPQKWFQNGLNKFKNRPQDGFKTALPQNSSPPKSCLTSNLPPEPPKSPQGAPKRPPRGVQEASKRPPEGPQGAPRSREEASKTLLNIWKTMSLNVILSNLFTYLLSYLT